EPDQTDAGHRIVTLQLGTKRRWKKALNDHRIHAPVDEQPTANDSAYRGKPPHDNSMRYCGAFVASIKSSSARAIQAHPGGCRSTERRSPDAAGFGRGPSGLTVSRRDGHGSIALGPISVRRAAAPPGRAAAPRGRASPARA